MFDDFFIRALVAGIGVAFVTGPLGCFVIWRRLSYFGDTLAHSALLGVTLAFTMEFNIALSVFIISSLIALILIQLQKKLIYQVMLCWVFWLIHLWQLDLLL